MLVSPHLHDILEVGTFCYPLLQRRRLRLTRGEVHLPRITRVGTCCQKQDLQTNDLETLEVVGGRGGSPNTSVSTAPDVRTVFLMSN